MPQDRYARFFIYFVCVSWCVILALTGPAVLWGTFWPEADNRQWPLIDAFFSIYFWGERLLSPERATPETRLAVNLATSCLWGVVFGRILIYIAVKRKSNNLTESER